MHDEVIFEETQRFKQWWLYVTMLGGDLIVCISLYRRYHGWQSIFNGPVPYLFIAAILVVVNLLIFSSRLDTVVKASGIYVKFYPFHRSFRLYAWEDISRCYVRQYSPLAEYGGWGLRWSLFGKGTAFNVSGDTGLQLEFWNGARLLIGTNMPNELTIALTESEHLTD